MSAKEVARKKAKKAAAPELPPDPRNAAFLTNYLDPTSPTYRNALQSGLKAGFSDSYSRAIMAVMPDWLSDAIREVNLQAEKDSLVDKAVRNMHEFMDMDDYVPVMGMFGPLKNEDGSPMMKRNSALTKIKADVTRHVFGDKFSPRKASEMEPGGTTNNTITQINIYPPGYKKDEQDTGHTSYREAVPGLPSTE